MLQIPKVRPEVESCPDRVRGRRPQSLLRRLSSRLRRGLEYMLRYGVPPPVMIFPDTAASVGQFPPLSTLGFDIPAGPARAPWTEQELPPLR